MDRVTDPWEAVAILRRALSDIVHNNKKDPVAPGYYMRVPVKLRRPAWQALARVPEEMARVQRDEVGRPYVRFSDVDTAALRDAADAILERSIPLSDQAMIVQRTDFEALRRARHRLRLVELDADTA